MIRNLLDRYWILIAGLTILLIAVVGYGLVVPDGPDDDPVPGVEEDKLLIQPAEDGTLLWPFTSRSESVEDKTLALNHLVYGDHERIEQRFRAGATDWDDRPYDDGDPDADGDIVPEPIRDIIWRDAHGANRFVYVESGGGAGEWIPESYQLYEGTYLGERNHVRVYESPDSDDEWVAMQAHEEYFDYFRLKHTVTSTNNAQRYVESEFIDDDRVRVSQEYLGNFGRTDSDGWVTRIEFLATVSLLGLVGSLAATRSRISRGLKRVLTPADRYRLREMLLAMSVLTLYLGVRIVGIGLEQALTIDPQLIAGALYPLLAVGLPLSVYRLGKPLRMDDAVVVTAGAFAGAVLFDFSLIGIVEIPRSILLHRTLLALSLGLIAAGASLYARGDKRVNTLLIYGASGWIGGLLLPLLDLL